MNNKILRLWYQALFENWFGVKLIIPFILLFINIKIGIFAFLVWVLSYLYFFISYCNKEESQKDEGKNG
jgi:hypothetical protein